MSKNDFCRIVNWYPILSEYSLFTGFLKLSADDVKLLSEGVCRGKAVRGIVRRSRKMMAKGDYGNYFVSTDCCSPTDTVRFERKRGAVHSAESAWFFLANSEKVRTAAQAGKIEYLALKPFIKIDKTREFRLFIHDGELKAMSQYNLERHFRRLEKLKDDLWYTVDHWFNTIKSRLPRENMVIDVVLQNDDSEVVVIDVNRWGEPTDPLLLRTFDQDWNDVQGIKLMLPPTKISGDVAVSF